MQLVDIQCNLISKFNRLTAFVVPIRDGWEMATAFRRTMDNENRRSGAIATGADASLEGGAAFSDIAISLLAGGSQSWIAS
jgi:hypothetical protein